MTLALYGLTAVQVALFDSMEKVHHWHPQLNNVKVSTPTWARSIGFGVRIGAQGVATPERIERCAKQIATILGPFARHAQKPRVPLGIEFGS